LSSSDTEEATRWPAEWERHRATWLTWPHNEETWPGRVERVEAAFGDMVAALAGREEVFINVEDARAEARVRSRLDAAGVPAAGLRFFPIPSDDAWVRDHGPLFVERDGRLAVVAFEFDAWGGKYPPWDRDARVSRRCAAALGVPCRSPAFVLEPGSIDGDGAGTVLTTEACLLARNRQRAGEPPRTRASVEALLAAELGARRVIWLADGIAGDDTDGHVDDFARFVAPGRVVCAQEPDRRDANHAPLRDALERLRAEPGLEVVPLPMPPPVVEDGVRRPASYANFYLANGVALVPTFGVPADETALRVLEGCLPEREVVPIPSRDLVVGLGAVHCLTQQVPALR
jgi:agmatine deiminase